MRVVVFSCVGRLFLRVAAAGCASLFAASLMAAGCAHGPITLGTQRMAPDKAAAASASGKTGLGDDEVVPRATGTWDWVYRSNDTGGNLRVEQEEWHLFQKGQVLEGYYDRAVTLLSTDDRLFKCNQQLGYTRFTRVRIGGSVKHGRVKMSELAFDAHSGPCDDGARSLTAYDGEIGPATMKLTFAANQGQQTLYRRPGDSGPRLAQLVGMDEKPTPGIGTAMGVGMGISTGLGISTGSGPRSLPSDDTHPSPAVSGVWEWILKSVDAEGDERVESEEWRLIEDDGVIKGHYERRVKRVRGDGLFSCNNESSYETTTRYEIEGHRMGEVVTLTETAYKAAHSKCDNGLRRLDTYQGSIVGAGSGGGELVLSWGSGNQVLRRHVEH